MAKKYLSLEEAAEYLGMSVDEVKQQREAGNLRGFADRANWKFRSEDLEEFKRNRTTTSDADVPILDPDSKGSVFDAENDDAENDDLSEQATVIRSGSIYDDDADGPLGASDSDVRLILGDDLSGSAASDSDSDVRLATDESDVHLADDLDDLFATTDSDVRLMGNDALPAIDESSSDVSLVPGGSDIALTSDDSGVFDSSGSEASVFDDEEFDTEGQTVAAGSGILREFADSGISLEAADSGISLELDDDSGIGIEGTDSGISLLSDDDDNLHTSTDSGISLGSDDSDVMIAGTEDSGIALLADDDDETIPLMGVRSSGTAETQMEIPTIEDDDDFELSGTDMEIPVISGQDDETSGFVVLDDEDADEFAPTTIRGRSGISSGGTDEVDEFEFDDEDEFDDMLDDDDLDVSPDIIGEDDGLDEIDVFDADDDDFDDSFQSGSSHATFTPQQVMVAAPPAEWGIGTCLTLLLSTGIMACAAAVMFDLVKSMWSWERESSMTSSLMTFLRDLL